MKKSFLSVTFLFLLLIVAIPKSESQSLGSPKFQFPVNLLILFEANEDQTGGSSTSLDKKEEIESDNSGSAEIKKDEKLESNPSSTKLSIELGKALFEKYMK